MIVVGSHTIALSYDRLELSSQFDLSDQHVVHAADLGLELSSHSDLRDQHVVRAIVHPTTLTASVASFDSQCTSCNCCHQCAGVVDCSVTVHHGGNELACMSHVAMSSLNCGLRMMMIMDQLSAVNGEL